MSKFLRVIIDTREQHPLDFTGLDVVVIRRKLDLGDYAVDGHEAAGVVERKGLSDFVASMGNWEDWAAKATRLAACGRSAIIVESSPDRIMKHTYFASTEPEVVLSLAVLTMQRYGVPILFAGTPGAAAALTARWLFLAVRQAVKKGD